MRFIGDCHGDFDDFFRLCDQPEHVIQVGDFGYRPDCLPYLDPARIKIVAGNHDNYDRESPHYYRLHQHYLPDFGLHEIPTLPPIFHCRGAWSIDKEMRIRGGLPWHEGEQLTDKELEDAFLLYRDARPSIVVTHEAPFEVVANVGNARLCRALGYSSQAIPTRTSQAFQRMLAFHRPVLWVFGHYHRFWTSKIVGTRFVCLDKLDRPRVDLDKCFYDLSESSFDALKSRIKNRTKKSKIPK